MALHGMTQHKEIEKSLKVSDLEALRAMLDNKIIEVKSSLPLNTKYR